MSEKQKVQAEDLYRFQWIEQPAAAPNGSQVIYVSRKVNAKKDSYDRHLRMIQADGSQDRAFTAGTNDRSPAWSPDGEQIAFLRPKDKKPQVWIMSAHGGEAHAVTDLKHGVGSFKWSPDGSSLLIAAEKEEPEDIKAQDTQNSSSDPQMEHSQDKKKESSELKAVIVDRITYKSDSSGLWEKCREHLYIYSLLTKSGEWLTSGEYDVDAYTWSPDSKQVAFSTHMRSEEDVDPDFVLTTDLYTIDVNGQQLKCWTQNNYGIEDIIWSPDGQSILFTASDESYFNATLIRAYSLSMQSEQITVICQDTELFMGNIMVGDTGIGSTFEPQFSPDGQFIYILCTHKGSVSLLELSADGSEHRVLLDGQRNIHYFTLAAEGKFFIVSADPLQPGELFCADPAAGTEVQLTHANDKLLSGLQLSKPQEFWLTSLDGRPLQAWLMPPVGEYSADHKVPAVLEIHGGPHTMYGYTFMLEFQLLCSQGYAVIFTNPRGSHGYGQQFVNGCRGDYGGGDYRDLMEVVDYMLEHIDWIDKDRLGVTGGSYGGFMTNWIVGQTDRFKAAVTQRSISNWISFYGVSDIGFYFTEDQIGGNPWEQLELLWKHSPLAYAGNVKTPLLILHGEKDLRCPIEQAEQWFTALKRLGATTRLVRFPEANHELSRSGHPQLRIQRLEQITGWFDQYL